jgi:probable rRNA maturation factor
MTHALEREGRVGPWALALRFVDDAEMAVLHDAYLGDPSPTDIMTFPYDPEDGEQGGDILISVDTAAANAAEHGWESTDELRFLALHGLLHILGWDDHEDAGRAAMLARQHELLAEWTGAS